jgi:hypothetical protein
LVKLTLEPPTTSVRLAAVVHLTHINDHGTIVRAANSFGLAGPVAGLLVHLYGDGAASGDGAFSGDALGAADVAAYIVGGDALGREG